MAHETRGAEAYIRPYQPIDQEALVEICLRTGDKGKDATHLYQDRTLLADIFATPYATLESGLAFVLDHAGQAVGYIVGTPDTVRFVHEFRTIWLPRVARNHPAPVANPVTLDEVMTEVLHRPERMLVPETAQYPAHLHIDLLPDYQRRGYGRGLMETFVAALAAAGAQGVHLCMATENKASRAFYERVGFREISVDEEEGLTYLGRTTAPA